MNKNPQKDLRIFQENVDEGTLNIRVNAVNGLPVGGARVRVTYTGGPQELVEELTTDSSGNTESLTLRTPPLEYSMSPNNTQPYAEYTIDVTAVGFRPLTISGIEVMSKEISLQNVQMISEDAAAS